MAWRSSAGGALLFWLLALLALAWVGLLWAWRTVTPGDARRVLLFGLAFRVAAFVALPVLEDDHHRFLWDGYRFATTGNPYAAAPQAYFSDDSVPADFRTVLDRINHPDVPTVYGPLTQWAFRLSHTLAPARLWPWKLLLLGAELALFVMLWPILPVRGRLLLAWCPLAIFETGFNAHPDVLALALVVAAWWLGRRSLFAAAGAVAGLAVATKIFAVLLVPFLLGRLGRRAWLMAAVAGFALYGPFWLRGSAADLAGLRAMAGEWEFNSSIFAVVAALTSRSAASVLCALGFGVVWLALFARWTKNPLSDPSENALAPGEWIYGAFLLLSATANPWYAVWLWPFVALRPSAVGVVALAAVSLSYLTGLNLGDATLGNFAHPLWVRPLEFGLIAAAAAWTWRKKSARPHAATGR